MSDAQRDPHVLISARADEHPKIIELPSDKARWGWIVLMGKAKLQRPPGRFASMRVLEAVLGEYRRFIPDYLKVGILEPEGSAVAVHDWQVHQRSRTQKWRDDNGLSSGHGNLRGNTGETHGETPGQPLARAGALSHSQSESSSSTGGGAGGGFAPVNDGYTRDGLIHVTPLVADAWMDAAGITLLGSGRKAQDTIDDICRRHAESKVLAAIQQARDSFDHIPEANALAFATRNITDPFLDRKAGEKKAAEQRESERSGRAVANTVRQIHGYGGHNGKPDPRCPECSRAVS